MLGNIFKAPFEYIQGRGGRGTQLVYSRYNKRINILTAGKLTEGTCVQLNLGVAHLVLIHLNQI